MNIISNRLGVFFWFSTNLLLMNLMLDIIQIGSIINIYIFDPMAADEGVKNNVGVTEYQEHEGELGSSLFCNDTLQWGNNGTTTDTSNNWKSRKKTIRNLVWQWSDSQQLWHTSWTSGLIITSKVLSCQRKNCGEHDALKEHDDNEKESHVWIGYGDDDNVKNGNKDGENTH